MGFRQPLDQAQTIAEFAFRALHEKLGSGCRAPLSLGLWSWAAHHVPTEVNPERSCLRSECT